MIKLTRQDLQDIIYGCTVLGTGGGGELQTGLDMVLADFDAGHEFNLVALEDVPDDVLIGSPYNAGSVSPLSEEDIAKFKKYEINEDYNLAAFQALEKFLGQKFYATITTELGGANSAVAFSVAARLGIPIVDGDPAGRSVPELQQSTFQLNGVSISPMSVASKFGDTVVIDKVVDGDRAEDLVRAMAAASQNTVGVTDHPITGKKIKTAAISGAISYALKIGKALREAREVKQDVGQAIAKAGEGYVLFRGVVKDHNWEDRAGFTYGNIYIDGHKEFQGDHYKIWYKNENLVTWKNGEPHVTGPDLVCFLDAQTGIPVTNPYHEKGMEVVIVGLPSAKEWREEKAIQQLSPEHFGFDIPYVPIEKIME